MKDGSSAKRILTHSDLEKAVGDAIAAFAVQMLIPDRVPKGVYFPEEVPSKLFREEILQFIKKDCLSSY